ncbi:DUF2946 domain-containing protein [[Empedobacter] haloabium]|uniref:DUF2946 domain-containing protein n=1 Tax=[Empedobacter] haloabium TaxID=592317 RepID=A0ABZ1UMJ6_9BURK
MRKLVRQQVLCLWLALIGMLFGALAPTVALAMTSAHSGADVMQVCTMEGMKTVVADAGDEAPAVKHCPYCVLHAHVALPPCVSGFLCALPADGAVRPALFYHSPTPLHPWTAASPRAPPR